VCIETIVAPHAQPPHVLLVVVHHADVSNLVADRRIRIELSPEAREWLAERGYDPVYGARPLRRIIQKHILNPLSREMLKVRKVARVHES
jgi:ATP-dependent Clp protease ATP-binding subunit ClpA